MPDRATSASSNTHALRNLNTNHNYSQTYRRNAPSFILVQGIMHDTRNSPAGQGGNGRNIANLPVEILLNIFSYFLFLEHHTAYDYYSPDNRTCENCGHSDWLDSVNQSLRTICHSRLVCRSFYNTASRHLFPFPRVSLSKSSLSRIDAFSRNPAIAPGIRGIRLDLSFRPAAIAADIEKFKSHTLSRLDNALACHDYEADDGCLSCLPRSHYLDIDFIRKTPGGRKKKNTALGNLSLLFRSWNTQDSASLAPESQSKVYYDMAIECHRIYQQKYQDQRELIEEGYFINTLVDIISRLPHFAALRFIDKGVSRETYLSHPDSISLLTDNNLLARYITTGMSWRHVESFEKLYDVTESLPISMFFDLPIAIHKAGITIRKVLFSCFPTFHSFSALQPRLESTGEPDWASWKAVFQNLEALDFGGGGDMHMGPSRLTPLNFKDTRYINDFISALLSGSRLESVRLNFHIYKTNEEYEQPSLFRAGGALRNLSLLHIKQLNISCVSLFHEELESLVDNIGPDLEHLFMYNMHLPRESWAPSIDKLSVKAAARRWNGGCKVYLKTLTGGEFGQVEETFIPSDHQGLGFPYRDWHFSQPIVQRAMDYVNGDESARDWKDTAMVSRARTGDVWIDQFVLGIY